MARRVTWTQIVLFGVAVVVLQAVILWPLRAACAIDITPERIIRLYDQFPDSVIPIWALTQDAPVEGLDDLATLSASPDTVNCPPSIEFNVTHEYFATRFDSVRGVTELYFRDAPNQRTIRYDIDSALNVASTILPLNAGIVWIAADLDLDGNIEVVTQISADVTIYSAPDWTQRAKFYWSGYNVVNNPTLVELDGDPYPEIFATPNTLGLTGRIVVIDYDPVADTFVKVVDYVAAEGAYGQPAVGDFDEDGRMEIIAGCDLLGYHVYEWQESTLVDIGFVGDSNFGGNNSATACRPLPNNKLLALLGHSHSTQGFSYEVLEATDDNAFETVDVFAESTGWFGVHPCWATDTDCDGLDELVTNFYSKDRVWEWDVSTDTFVIKCIWDNFELGGLNPWTSVDLDQNGAAEWAAANHLEVFRAFPDPDCINCDSLGVCPANLCLCDCFGDPDGCQGEINVFDVVSSVDEAFRSGPPIVDPSWLCPYTDNDVTCNNVADVFDVVAIVDVAFRSADPADVFCDPCAP